MKFKPMSFRKYTPTSFPAHLFAIRGKQKRPWNTSNTFIKIFPNRGDFFRIIYGIRQLRY